MIVPDGWRATQVGELAIFSSGGTPSKKNPAYWGGVHPWISGKDLKQHYLYTSIDKLTDEGFESAKQASIGSTLILVRGMTLLKDFPVGYVAKRVSFNQDIKALQPNEGVDGLYLSFLMAGNKNLIKQLVSTAGHGTGRLDTESIKSFPVNIPPKKEQKRIAKILSTWDRAIDVTKQLISNSQQQKKALIQQLLTGRSRLPGFSGEWNCVKFEEVLDIEIGGTPSRSMPEYWDDQKLTRNRWLSIRDLQGNKILDTSEYISDLGVKNSNVTLISAGTIVMSFKLTIGRYAFLGIDCYTNEAISALIIKRPEKLDDSYLFHALSIVDFDREIDQAVKGKTLNKAKLKRLFLKLPSLDEQKQIASVLFAADQEIETLQQKLNCLKQEKRALMQQLLTGKRRVKISDNEFPKKEVVRA